MIMFLERAGSHIQHATRSNLARLGKAALNKRSCPQFSRAAYSASTTEPGNDAESSAGNHGVRRARK
ncbi:MAG: hypothetical protein K2Y37_00630 [Pirellulales bacterium]|nr:hypothetical protein [Pirellulales bacterium]